MEIEKISVAIGLTILVAIVGMVVKGVLLWRHKRASNLQTYYEALVSQLQTATAKANQIMDFINETKDSELIAYYESATTLLENLLQLVSQVRVRGMDQVNIKSALYLAQNCAHRMERVYQVFTLAQKRKPYNLRKLCDWKLKPDASIRGCYFCSKPHLDGSFHLVKARIEGKTLKVASCSSCAELLEQKKLVKILHFRRDGKLVHWSEVEEYKPDKDFWTVRSKSVDYTRPKLTLIENRPLTEDDDCSPPQS